MEVVTVQLSVEKDLDPRWELVTDRGASKVLYSGDRALFGVVRLGAETDSHLTWGQYSHLAKLSEQKDSASNALTSAFRQAKATVKGAPLAELNESVKEVRKAAIRLGAYDTGGLFEAGLDTQRLLSSLSGLSLHNHDIPLRMSGLGSRRLTALAVERLSIAEGAIVLVDELEHGLEPHRIRHAIKVLREEHQPDSKGQVILTTHSPTTIVELSTDDLAIAVRAGGELQVVKPNTELQAQLRRDPETFFSRRIVVCEGKTELGLVRALRPYWANKHDGESLAYRGVGLGDGSGSSGPEVAMNFARLGFSTLLLRDSDVALPDNAKKELNDAAVTVLEWEGDCSTEQRLFADADASAVQALLDIAYEMYAPEKILPGLEAEFGFKVNSQKFTDWLSMGVPEKELRQKIATVAMSQKLPKKRTGWFKSISGGQQAGEVVREMLEAGLAAPLASTLKLVEDWAYAG